MYVALPSDDDPSPLSFMCIALHVSTTFPTLLIIMYTCAVFICVALHVMLHIPPTCALCMLHVHVRGGCIKSAIQVEGVCAYLMILFMEVFSKFPLSLSLS